MEAVEKRKKFGLKHVMIILGVFFVMALAGIGTETGDETAEDLNKAYPSEAVVMAEEFVKSRLKAPGTAEFNSYDPDKVTEIEKNKFKVTGWVDAENSFGAKIRSNYLAVVRYEPEQEKWYLEEISIN